MESTAPWIVRAVLISALAGFRSEAQSLYGLDGAGSIIVEASGPPAGPCPAPNGPFMSAFPTFVPFACPTVFAAGPPPGVILGDVAVNVVTDTIWATDGFTTTEYTRAGVALNSFPLMPGFGLLTGLGMDSMAGILWITDGFVAMGIFPPPAPGCGAVAAVAVPPFPAPGPGPVTDIEWDPVTGSLLFCDVFGVVSNVFPGGGVGPFGAFPVAPGPCGLIPVLQGLAVNTAYPFGPTSFYVTDGFMVAHLLPGGGPAPATFYSPFPCFPTLGPLLGLAFAARALPFGIGSDTSGFGVPTIGSVLETITPNPGFVTTVTGAAPLSPAFLFIGLLGPICPPFTVAGLSVYLSPAGISSLGVTVTDAFGSATFATPIPPFLPPGLFASLEWVVNPPGPGLQATEGLEVTISIF